MFLYQKNGHFISSFAITAESQRYLDNIFVERLWRSVKHEDGNSNPRTARQMPDRAQFINFPKSILCAFARE